MKYVRMFTTDDGETHMERHEVPFEAVDFMPGVPPLNIFNLQLAGPLMVVETPEVMAKMDRAASEAQIGYRNAPGRFLVVPLVGSVEVITSDGDSEVVSPGSFIVAEDVTGKGHLSVCHGVEQLAMFAPLAS